MVGIIEFKRIDGLGQTLRSADNLEETAEGNDCLFPP